MMVDLRFGGSVWCNIDIALRHIEAVYQQETRVLGLSVIEWYVLRMLYEQDGQMASRLAEGVGRPATSFTPILDGIENKGLLERRSHPGDRRAVKIHLTAKGQALKAQVFASAEQIESKLRQRFSGKEWQDYESVVANLQTMTP
jgi:MarR family transcriptional regulator, organic hydroperoxide resistance regulator